MAPIVKVELLLLVLEVKCLGRNWLGTIFTDGVKLKRVGYIGTTPPARMPVTTWIIPFFVGNPYKPSFVTVYWVGGVDLRDIY